MTNPEHCLTSPFTLLLYTNFYLEIVIFIAYVEHVSSCLMFVVVVVAVVGNWTLDLMTPLDDLTLNFDLTKVRLCLVYP